MKKIGIMTMHRILNYGSFLQAYALKKTIQSLGYEVEFVDYRFEKSLIPKNNRKILNYLRITKIKEYLKRKKIQKRFLCVYNDYLSKYLHVTDEKNYAYEIIDELVIGSDEVFNCIQQYPVGYSRELFGKNYENIPVISYAACFGSTTLELLKKYQIDNEIKELLGNFQKISVRDNNSAEIVKTLIQIEPEINLDPVLITNLSDETIDNVDISNYILVYSYANRMSDNEIKQIKKLAKENNKKIVCLGAYQKFADYNIIAEPFEVMAYFAHADFIITDTFHGSVFSIKNNKKFCTIIRETNKNKLVDLLKRLKLEDRILVNISNINILYSQSIDYTATNTIIENERKQAINYLKRNLVK